MRKLACCLIAALLVSYLPVVTNSFAWDEGKGHWKDKGCSHKPTVPSAKVTAPAWTPDRIGDVSRNYPFFSPYADLADYGYVQEEFFIEGLASNYNTPTGATGSAVVPRAG